MYVMNYFGELNALAARQAVKEGLTGEELHARQEYLAHEPTADMRKGANELALHNTFQSKLGKFGSTIQNAIRNDPSGLAKYMFPFFRTPINLAKATAEYSPIGLLRGTLKGDVDAQARGLVGSTLAAGIAYLALNGHVTGGGPTDLKKRETLEATGWQPYSVKIGDRYYSYHRAEPLGLAIGLTADAVHGMKTGDSEVVSQSKADTAVAHIIRNLESLPFLFQLSAITEALHDPSGKRIDSFIAKQIASFVPALAANMAQGIDPTVRRPGGNTLPEIIKQNVESRVPGLTTNVPAVTDITGRTVQRPASALGGANPFPVSKANNDPVIQELASLGIATTQPPASVKMKGKSFQLTGTERQQLAQQEGDLLRGKVAKWIATKAWASLDDDQRRKKIAELRRDITATRPQRLTKLRNRALGNEINARRDSSRETSSE